MKFLKRKNKQILLIITILFLMFNLVQKNTFANVLANNTNEYNYKYDEENKKIIASNLTVLDSDGKNIPIGEEEDFSSSIDNIVADLEEGEKGATKRAVFESQFDKKAGIVKTTFDVAAKPNVQGKDIVLVLDVSASMSMWINDGAYSLPYVGKAGAASTSPCLNEDHYYSIPSGTWGAKKDIYFNVVEDFGGVVPWYTISSSQWLAFESKYELSLPKELKDPNSDIFGSIQALRKNTKIGEWKPQSHHYYYDGFSYIHIPDEPTVGLYYSSPGIGNPEGCYDRMMLLNEVTKELVTSFLAENSENRISIINFSSSTNNLIDKSFDFSSNLTDVINSLPITSTFAITNYESGLNQAVNFLNNRSNTTRKAYTMLISDGSPNAGNALSGANNLKDNTNSELYVVGFQVGNSTLLSSLATDDNHYKDCSSSNEFTEYFKGITENITESPKAKLTDIIGKDFNLICDDEHPITIGDIEYFSFDSIPTDLILLSEDRTKIEWNCSNVGIEGERITFYTKLKDDIQFNENSEKFINTNQDASLDYDKEIGNTIISEKVVLNSPIVKVENSILKVEKTNNRMTDNNPYILGEIVKLNDLITYTFKVSNEGGLDLDSIILCDKVPEGTEYVSGGEHNEGNVIFDIPKLLKGDSKEISFVVRVISEHGLIENTGEFGFDFAANKSEYCSTNTMVNPIKKLDEVEEVKLKSTSITVKANKLLDGGAPSNDSFLFSLKDKDGNVLQTKSNIGGKIIFDPLILPKEKTYTFFLVENIGNDKLINYDTSTYKVEIEVIKNSESYEIKKVNWFKNNKLYNDSFPIFENTSVSPVTGDLNNKQNWIIIMFIMMGSISLILFRKWRIK